MPSTPVVRLQPSYEHSLKAKIVVRKNDRIASKSRREILWLIYRHKFEVSLGFTLNFQFEVGRNESNISIQGSENKISSQRVIIGP